MPKKSSQRSCYLDMIVLLFYLQLQVSHLFQVNPDHLVVHQDLASHGHLSGQDHRKDLVYQAGRAVLDGQKFLLFQEVLHEHPHTLTT